MNVNDAISDYLMDIGHLDKRTVEDYRQRLTVFADWCDQEHVELEQVNNRMVQAFLTWLPAHHHPQKHGKLTLSTAALYGYTLYIKVFLSWCLQDEEYSQYTTLARVKGVRMPHKEKRLKHIFTDDEIAFEAAKHPSKTHEYQLRDLAIVALLLDTGIRASELRALSIGNVTLGRAPGEDSYVRVLGKGKKEREIPLGRQTRRILSRYIRACRQHAAKNAPVFPSRQGGGQLSHQGLKDLLLRIKAVSTLPDDCLVHPHKFRHTYASKFILAA